MRRPPHSSSRRRLGPMAPAALWIPAFELVKKSASSSLGSAASPSIVLRQAQHEDRFFVASADKNNLILSLSKDEPPRQRPATQADPAARRAPVDFFTGSFAGMTRRRGPALEPER